MNAVSENLPVDARTVIVSGMIAADPHQGGAAWAVLQYVLGLRELGHDVYFVEPLPQKNVQNQVDWTQSESAHFFRKVISDFALQERAALLLAGTQETVGLSYRELQAAAERATVLLNISGMLADQELLRRIACRVYLDLDPAFIQLWHSQGIDMRLDAHSHFVTVGLSLGTADCPVPTCGAAWIKTLSPIVLSHWPRATSITHDGLTTVGNWRGYGSVEHQGVQYGQKVHSWRQLIRLPQRCPVRCLPALAIHAGETADWAALQANHWQVSDPRQVAGTPEAYRQFVQGSWAELGIAKSGYVLSNCGWFSDRSVCYLASGRPVIAQETGFSRHLPIGEGLFAFRTEDDILAVVAELQRDYPRHSQAARALAESRFDSSTVLTQLFNQLGLTA